MAPDRTDRPVAILLALEVEARTLIRTLAHSRISSPQISVWKGVVEGASVVLAITGVGKVAAALGAQFICDVFAPRCFLAVGLAGATDSDWQRGQLVLASGALQHDVDARPFTDAKGVIPSLGKTVLAPDATLFEKLRSATESVVDNPPIVRSVGVLTGDQIVTSRAVKNALLAEFPDAPFFDTQPAAIAPLTPQNGSPGATFR